MSKWVTIVGEHAPRPKRGEPEAKGYWPEQVEADHEQPGPCTEGMRDVLLFERGGLLDRPDDKPDEQARVL